MSTARKLAKCSAGLTMEHTNRKQLETFDHSSLPDLDVVVLGALELFASTQFPVLPDNHNHPLVLGSVNAARTGKILFSDTNASYADESEYLTALQHAERFDAVYIISASGGKHAISMARAAHEKNLPTYLFTNNPGAPARTYVTDEQVLVFPKNREPYTYNTSTYLSMIMAKTGEFAPDIHTFITGTLAPLVPRNFSMFDAFTLIIPANFSHLTGMMQTKFDELFGPMLTGRVFTEEEVKHAKTVVQSGTECFIGFGVPNDHYGISHNRVSLPLPDKVGYGAMLAVGYYVIGEIQKQKPSYFKQNIERYVGEASQIFGHNISPIVE